MQIFQEYSGWSCLKSKRRAATMGGERFRKGILVNYSLIIYQSGHESVNSSCDKHAMACAIEKQRVDNLVRHASE